MEQQEVYRNFVPGVPNPIEKIAFDIYQKGAIMTTYQPTLEEVSDKHTVRH